MCQNNLGIVPVKIGLDNVVNHLEVEKNNLLAWSELANAAHMDDLEKSLSEVIDGLANISAKLSKTADDLKDEDAGGSEITITPFEAEHKHPHEHGHEHEHPHAHGDEESHIHKHDEGHH
ncbi:MAG: hypothetical protein M1378_06345 [Bacteroidetes bacterium]|nr:hypothetical protein [Bacteroidota bacterium]